MYVLSMGSTPVSQNWFDWKNFNQLIHSQFDMALPILPAAGWGSGVLSCGVARNAPQSTDRTGKLDHQMIYIYILMRYISVIAVLFVYTYIHCCMYVMFIYYPWLYITRVYIYIYIHVHMYSILCHTPRTSSWLSGDAVRTVWDSPNANSINHPRFFHQTWVEMVGKTW